MWTVNELELNGRRPDRVTTLEHVTDLAQALVESPREYPNPPPAPVTFCSAAVGTPTGLRVYQTGIEAAAFCGCPFDPTSTGKVNHFTARQVSNMGHQPHSSSHSPNERHRPEQTQGHGHGHKHDHSHDHSQDHEADDKWAEFDYDGNPLMCVKLIRSC